MQNTVVNQLEEVARLRHEKPQEVIAQALEIGLAKMWQDGLLEKYLDRQISRKKAIQLLGLELVRLAEQQDKLVQEDVKWGLSRGTNRS